MYNKSRLTVRVKHFKSKMVQTSLMLQPLISIGGHLCYQHSKCEAALTYMISGTTLMTLFNTVKLLLIIFV